MYAEIKNPDIKYQSIHEELLQLQSTDWLLSLDGSVLKRAGVDEIGELVEALKTKKQTQRALNPDEPAPATVATTTPSSQAAKSTTHTYTGFSGLTGTQTNNSLSW